MLSRTFEYLQHVFVEKKFFLLSKSVCNVHILRNLGLSVQDIILIRYWFFVASQGVLVTAGEKNPREISHVQLCNVTQFENVICCHSLVLFKIWYLYLVLFNL